MSSAEDSTHWRELIRLDWVVARSWNRLHAVELTDAQVAVFEDETIVEGPVRLACGQTAASITIPGFTTRLGAPRCVRCCRATGLPPGTGSPKNSPECRSILGLPAVTG